MSPRFDYVGLVVSDMATSLAFYRRIGLDIPTTADELPHVEISFPGGARIAWDTVESVRSYDPLWSEPVGGNRVNLAFRCSAPSDVDRVYAEITNAGYRGHKAPWDASWLQRVATVNDPDGNSLDFYAPL